MPILDLSCRRLCSCPANHLNCLDAKEWMRAQIGVWQFYYERRDIRDKQLHPATFPISLARRCIELFTHRGELVLDPFVGSGTTLLAAQDAGRNAAGFDLNPDYIDLSLSRLATAPPATAPRSRCNRDRPPDQKERRGEGEKESAEGAGPDGIGTVPGSDREPRQLAVEADAREIPDYLEPESVGLLLTSPPYANLLNRRRLNKSRRGDLRRNDQYLKVEQYSQDPRDLGTLALDEYEAAMEEVFRGVLPLLRPRAHCVVNVPDMWWQNRRITIHIAVVAALERAGYELRNTIIWDRTNIVNRIGIFGWPSNYITMGTTFEYLLDFWKPPSSTVAG